MSNKNNSDRQPGRGRRPQSPSSSKRPSPPREVGGRKNGLEPTRYGDWEKNGRCIDF